MLPLTQIGLLPLCALLCVLLAATAGAERNSPQRHNIRWGESKPGCTFSQDDDGKYRWGLWVDDVGVILAVDSQELQRTHRRIQPFLAVLLTVRYRGTDKLHVSAGRLSLEFVKHSHVMKHPLDPEEFATEIQNDAKEVANETEQQMQKHPEQKQKKEILLHDYQNQVEELLDFVTKRSLREVTLDPVNPETKGWAFFSTRDKWIGAWKKPEEFVLRFPLEKRVLEFPLTLPPGKDDLILRRRPN
jgi:hypothetical protein